jgi:SAM-dependent methyltransferase
MSCWITERPETVYSHRKRLTWMLARLPRGGCIVEFGCGTGIMLTVPLNQEGYRVTGLDRDRNSIDMGRRLAVELGLTRDVLRNDTLSGVESPVDAIIASEVLEHIPGPDLDGVLSDFAGHLDPGGRLLITVPNGFGWYEMESWVWKRTGLGALITGSLFERGVRYVKMRISGYSHDQLVEPYPSSLDSSPHVQRFTLTSVIRRVEAHGFVACSYTGSGLVAGQLSNLLWTGLDPATRFNNWLGSLLPRVASGFFIEFERSQ